MRPAKMIPATIRALRLPDRLSWAKPPCGRLICLCLLPVVGFALLRARETASWRGAESTGASAESLEEPPRAHVLRGVPHRGYGDVHCAHVGVYDLAVAHAD